MDKKSLIDDIYESCNTAVGMIEYARNCADSIPDDEIMRLLAEGRDNIYIALNYLDERTESGAPIEKDERDY